MKDIITNMWLGLKNRIRYYAGVYKSGSYDFPPDYTEVLRDLFISLDKWETHYDDWQPYHPDFPHQWYDPDQVKRTGDGVEFSAIEKPRYFPALKRTILYAIGKIRSKEGYKYGIFIVTAKLPTGKGLHAALWLSGLYMWPPEIDIVEAYSKNTIDFNKYNKLESNAYIKDVDRITYGATNHACAAAEGFIEYTLWWEQDFIRIYYNRYKVLEITDKKFLSGMNEPMQLILGTGTQKDYFCSDNLSTFVVRSVKIFQRK
jgi:beta-glucanase (GH16 family)